MFQVSTTSFINNLLRSTIETLTQEKRFRSCLSDSKRDPTPIIKKITRGVKNNKWRPQNIYLHTGGLFPFLSSTQHTQTRRRQQRPHTHRGAGVPRHSVVEVRKRDLGGEGRETSGSDKSRRITCRGHTQKGS